MKSIVKYINEGENTLLADLRYARNKVHEIDSILNGLEDDFEEYKDNLQDFHNNELKKLRELQEEMENILTDIYQCEGGRY